MLGSVAYFTLLPPGVDGHTQQPSWREGQQERDAATVAASHLHRFHPVASLTWECSGWQSPAEGRGAEMLPLPLPSLPALPPPGQALLGLVVTCWAIMSSPPGVGGDSASPVPSTASTRFPSPVTPSFLTATWPCKLFFFSCTLQSCRLQTSRLQLCIKGCKSSVFTWE